MTASLLRATVVSLAVVVLSACSWRVETPPPEWPSPGPVTVMRDAAAAREQAVLDAATYATGAASATTAREAVLSEIEASAAPERIDALGGVYVPYPDASPSPSASAEPVDVIDLAAQARDGHLADALVAEDPDLAFLLTSAGLSHALSSWYAGWVEDAIAQSSQPVVADRVLDSTALPESGPVPTTTSAGPEVLAELAVMHDQARYSYEVLAARATEDERDRWLARRDIQAARAEALARVSGVEDGREAVYTVPGDASADAAARAATAQALEIGAAQTYVAMLDGAAEADVPWLLQAAFDAYAQATAFGGPTADTYPVPALPGVALDRGPTAEPAPTSTPSPSSTTDPTVEPSP